MLCWKRSFDYPAAVSSVLFAAFALYASIALAVQPIKVQGSEFVNSVNNDRFEIIGVAYVCPNIRKSQRMAISLLTALLVINLEGLLAS